MSRQPSTEYHLDSRDRLVFMDDGWDRFARTNETPDLRAEKVVGRSLWDYVHGMEVRSVWRSILRRVRETGVGLDLPFRCDSPGYRRSMQMELSIDDQTLRFKTFSDDEVPRIPIELLQAEHRSDVFVKVCSWCTNVADDTGWIGIEQAADRGGWLEGAPVPQMTHGICESCAESLEV